jgi:hypothetical protein
MTVALKGNMHTRAALLLTTVCIRLLLFFRAAMQPEIWRLDSEAGIVITFHENLVPKRRQRAKVESQRCIKIRDGEGDMCKGHLDFFLSVRGIGSVYS